MLIEIKSLKNVKVHNSQNPYTDISPYVLKVDFPIVDYPNFALAEKELFLYATPAGLYDAAGDVSMFQTNVGDLIITNQRIAFVVEEGAFQCPIADVKACEIVNDEMVLIETKTKSYAFQVNQELTPYVHMMVILALQQPQVGRDLFEYRMANAEEIEKKMQSEEYKRWLREYEEFLV